MIQTFHNNTEAIRIELTRLWLKHKSESEASRRKAAEVDGGRCKEIHERVATYRSGKAEGIHEFLKTLEDLELPECDDEYKVFVISETYEYTVLVGMFGDYDSARECANSYQFHDDVLSVYMEHTTTIY